MPWNARAAISWPAFCAKPATIEPSTKIDDGDLDQQLLVEQVGELAPDRGGDAVAVSRVAVTTQVYWVCEPFRRR